MTPASQEQESAIAILSDLFIWRGSITLALSIPLVVYSCFSYGVKRVANVREKSFHATMFYLMLLCGVFYAVGGCLQLVSAKQDLTNEIMLKAIVISNGVAWLLNLMLHALFVVKYWLVSQRVEAILLQKPEESVKRIELYGRVTKLLLFSATIILTGCMLYS